MIILTHDSKQIVSCYKAGKALAHYHQKPLVKTFFQVAQEFTNHLLIWVHQDYQQALNYSAMDDIFHHKRIMASYALNQYLSKAIGYVEQGPFINVNHKVKYPTWRMHQDVGGVHTSVINAVKPHLNASKNLDYVLHSLAKLAQQQGLLCYSYPDLLKAEFPLKPVQKTKASLSTLFRFIAQHYKWIWKHFMFLNLFIHENKFPILGWLRHCLTKQIKPKDKLLEDVSLLELRPFNNADIELDVIIPTIGRKKYLYDVLKDLSKQSLLPKRIIIVEQNPDLNSVSELDYLQTETWPFEINLEFTHQTGACKARNMALDKVKSKWVFLADDDNRMSSNLIENVFKHLETYKLDCITTVYIQKHEINSNKEVVQWPTFGAGNSFVNFKKIENLRFHKGLEHGYGEDVDFGMQIRNLGIDVIFSPQIIIDHLKAPIGGFRSKPLLAWRHENPLPKPSPTVLLSKLLHNTKEQVLGYKVLLFINTLKSKGYQHFFSHLHYFKKAWATSEYWAKKLHNQNS